MKKVLIDFGSKEALKIANVLLNAKDEETTDEKIATISNVKLNVVRRILYILNENKLTEFKRVKDKRSGWFISYWIETFDNLPVMLEERRNRVIDKLEARLSHERDNYFFKCDACTDTKRYVFVEAMEYNFHCQNCNGGNLVAENNTEKVALLQTTLQNLWHA